VLRAATLSDRLMGLLSERFSSSKENLLAVLKQQHPELRLTWNSLWDLMAGTQENPSIALLEALAEVFRVDPAYFFASHYTESAYHLPSVEQVLAPLELKSDEVDALLASPPSLADKLTLVLEVARDEETRKPYTMSSLSKKLGEIGIQTTPGYMAFLGSGAKRNPSKAIVEGIARIVHIDVAYFIASVFAWPIYVELNWLSQLQKADIQYLASRTLADTTLSGAARIRQVLRLLKEEP
jgi:hypothetical protein